MRDDHSTLVLVPRGNEGARWRGPGTIILSNYALLEAALHAGVTEYGKEIARVVLDRSVDHADFLDFLSRLPVGFRGDVLLVLPSGGYLSAMARGDGRYLYSLTPSDIEFYRRTALGESDAARCRASGSVPSASAYAAREQRAG
ncbi:MAG TPA: hypothetical protein VMS56_05525 [Thermoanaerobaculia bacterium]|nr:hypothetical protein [Thermoanaerobaculia bacterium]